MNTSNLIIIQREITMEYNDIEPTLGDFFNRMLSTGNVIELFFCSFHYFFFNLSIFLWNKFFQEFALNYKVATLLKNWTSSVSIFLCCQFRHSLENRFTLYSLFLSLLLEEADWKLLARVSTITINSSKFDSTALKNHMFVVYFFFFVFVWRLMQLKRFLRNFRPTTAICFCHSWSSCVLFFFLHVNLFSITFVNARFISINMFAICRCWVGRFSLVPLLSRKCFLFSSLTSNFGMISIALKPFKHSVWINWPAAQLRMFKLIFV